MSSISDRSFMLKEQERLARFQHQHRGLNFLKVWLPPDIYRNVNIIGLNNHVFKGQIPSVPIDELPPDVDPKSMNEEELYEEIKNMKFPKVPSQEPLGPARRIGGEYTRAKQLFFAPVRVQHKSENKKAVSVLGADGHVYRGTVKPAVVTEMNQKLRGTKRSVRSRKAKGPIRETIEPSAVSLYVDGKTLPENGQPPVPLIHMPISQLNRMLVAVRRQEERKNKKSSKGSEEDSESKNLEEDFDSNDSEEDSDLKDSEEDFGSKEFVSKDSGSLRDIEEGSAMEGSEAGSGSRDSKDYSGPKDYEKSSGLEESVDSSNSKNSKKLSGSIDAETQSISKNSDEHSDSKNFEFEKTTNSKDSFVTKDPEEVSDAKNYGLHKAFYSQGSSEKKDYEAGSFLNDSDQSYDAKKFKEGSDTKNPEEGSDMKNSEEGFDKKNSEESLDTENAEKDSETNFQFEKASHSKDDSETKHSGTGSNSKDSEKEHNQKDSKEGFTTKNSEESSQTKYSEEGSILQESRTDSNAMGPEETFDERESQTTGSDVDVPYNEPTFTYHTDENNDSQMIDNYSISGTVEDSEMIKKDSLESKNEESRQGSDKQ